MPDDGAPVGAPDGAPDGAAAGPVVGPVVGPVLDAPACPHCGEPVEVRVGTDVQAVAPVLDSLRGPLREAYLARVFTASEQADAGVGTSPDEVAAAGLAARFAAKEAVIKVLRPDDVALPWTEVEVRREPAGWTHPRLSGTAARLARESGLRSLALSITHDGGVAAATVVSIAPHGARGEPGSGLHPLHSA